MKWLHPVFLPLKHLRKALVVTSTDPVLVAVEVVAQHLVAISGHEHPKPMDGLR
jgi:hypothetical protein